MGPAHFASGSDRRFGERVAETYLDMIERPRDLDEHGFTQDMKFVRFLCPNPPIRRDGGPRIMNPPVERSTAMQDIEPEHSRRRTAKRGNGEGGIYQRKSDGRWCASVSLHNRRRKVIYGKTRKEVALKLNNALLRKQHGIQFGPATLTIGDWLDHWLEQVVKTERAPTTFEGYEISVRCHIKPALGRIKLVKLRPEDVQRWQREMESQKRGLRTREFALARLRTALNLALKHGHVLRNVAELVDMPRSARRRITAPTAEDVRRLLDAIKGDRLEAIVTVALVLGLRRGEILGLQWEDIDLD